MPRAQTGSLNASCYYYHHHHHCRGALDREPGDRGPGSCSSLSYSSKNVGLGVRWGGPSPLWPVPPCVTLGLRPHTAEARSAPDRGHSPARAAQGSRWRRLGGSCLHSCVSAAESCSRPGRATQLLSRGGLGHTGSPQPPPTQGLPDRRWPFPSACRQENKRPPSYHPMQLGELTCPAQTLCPGSPGILSSCPGTSYTTP